MADLSYEMELTRFVLRRCTVLYAQLIREGKPIGKMLAWAEKMLDKFGEDVGVSLQDLEVEFEKLMSNFDEKAVKINIFSPSYVSQTIDVIRTEEMDALHPPSPTESNTSRESQNKDLKIPRTLSAVSLSSSIKDARKRFRRRFTHKKNRSVSSLPKCDSESSSLERENEHADAIPNTLTCCDAKSSSHHT